jgi:AMMECR1 domain-containing protein
MHDAMRMHKRKENKQSIRGTTGAVTAHYYLSEAVQRNTMNHAMSEKGRESVCDESQEISG